MHSAAELEGPARAAVAAVAARLAGALEEPNPKEIKSNPTPTPNPSPNPKGALEEPPTYAAGGHVLYCETLRISEVEIG